MRSRDTIHSVDVTSVVVCCHPHLVLCGPLVALRPHVFIILVTYSRLFNHVTLLQSAVGLYVIVM